MRMATATSAILRVDLNSRGSWDVALPDGSEPVTCETMEQARRVAYEIAAGRRPCELIVCDAYHRVLHRELVDGSGHRLIGFRA
jgi:hypothetical protein